MALESQKAHLYAPNLPWNCYKAEELGAVTMQFCKDHEPFFRRWAQVWYENFQFLFGNQNVKWSRRYGFAVDYDWVRSDQGMGQRANTNLSRVVTEALASYVFAQLPEWDAETTDDSNIKGKRYRKIVQKILDAYTTRLCCEKEFQVAAVNFVLFGQFGAVTEWNRLAGQLLEIPRYIKQMIPQISTRMAANPFTGGQIETPYQLNNMMGQPGMEERWVQAMDANGRKIVDKLFAGDVGIHILTPFELRREIGSYGMHKTRYVQRFRLMDYDEFMEVYKDTPGATPLFKRVRPVYSDTTVYNMAINHFMRMQFTSPPALDDNRGMQNLFNSTLFKYKVFVIEHWDKPHPDKWPNGRRVVVANGECTHITKPDYSTNKLDGWHPFTEAQWMTVNPNSIAAGPLNDVIRKNKEINVKDSLIATAVRRNMGSQLLIDTASGIDPQRMSGEPGMAHVVTDIMGARYLNDDVPIPPVIARLRELDKEDIYDTSGAQDALRGEPSSGATSGYQEKLREEREERRLRPAKTAFEGGISSIGEKLIACLKANVKKLDDSVVGVLKRSGAGEFTIQDVVAFLSTPIDYGVDIKVVKSSMSVKSRASEQATLQELSANPGVANRLATDAKVLDAYLKAFDIEVLRDASSVHRDRANREDEVFLDILRLGPNTEGITKPVVVFEDDDAIHIAEHDECLLRNFEEFSANEQQMAYYIEHIETHRLQQQEKQGEAVLGAALVTGQMMQGAMAQPKPDLKTVAMETQQKNAMEAKMMSKSPQSPRLPSSGGGAPGTIDVQAPSQNTPTAEITKGGL